MFVTIRYTTSLEFVTTFNKQDTITDVYVCMYVCMYVDGFDQAQRTDRHLRSI